MRDDVVTLFYVFGIVFFIVAVLYLLGADTMSVLS